MYKTVNILITDVIVIQTIVILNSFLTTILKISTIVKDMKETIEKNTSKRYWWDTLDKKQLNINKNNGDIVD